MEQLYGELWPRHDDEILGVRQRHLRRQPVQGGEEGLQHLEQDHLPQYVDRWQCVVNLVLVGNFLSCVCFILSSEQTLFSVTAILLQNFMNSFSNRKRVKVLDNGERKTVHNVNTSYFGNMV